jgi:predicted DNA-binding protein
MTETKATKTEHLWFRMEPEVREKLERLAGKHGESMGVFLRRLIREEWTRREETRP